MATVSFPLPSRIHKPLFEKRKAFGLSVDNRYDSVSFSSYNLAEIGLNTATQNNPIPNTAKSTGVNTPQMETPDARIITNSFVLLNRQKAIIVDTIITKGTTLSTVSGSFATTYCSKKPTDTSFYAISLSYQTS